jgi:hypothetical protein
VRQSDSGTMAIASCIWDGQNGIGDGFSQSTFVFAFSLTTRSGFSNHLIMSTVQS